MLYQKLFTLLFLILAGCSEFNVNHYIYRPEIHQGYYSININAIHKGMTQQQVIAIIGTPSIKLSFSNNVWCYFFSNKLKDNKKEQNTVIIKFNSDGILTHIKNIKKII
ncbi:outer membrane protein assembly factor BamE [Candidatus Pantoea edessiphila]|uniref:Outer membrane protein assembly factor BamE n=1 Tax=Candidatus Pantoea edessiphila TaxID=2044610 RepID=A0A2P5SYC5_9GAMM|nr:outer membrane protein assembly factor BamE [Candidatus Pantoea edessiphila]MBK4775535.1 outer membrane protein assembly factor BamE [Pantoea sp. Edef]PPI87339.1 outer membrane protein assembly factor BamE [Candidatus Pantoea edessiphila]